jgi:hypothetical protein
MKFAYPLLVVALLPLAACNAATTGGSQNVGGYSAPAVGSGGLSAMNVALRSPSPTQTTDNSKLVSEMMAKGLAAEGISRGCPRQLRINPSTRDEHQIVMRLSRDELGWAYVSSAIARFETIARENCWRAVANSRSNYYLRTY